MYRRPKRIALAVCVLISVLSLYQKTGYLLYSAITTGVQLGAIVSTSGSEINPDNFPNRGKSQEDEFSPGGPGQRVKPRLLSRINTILNQGAAKRLMPDQIRPRPGHVTRPSSNQSQSAEGYTAGDVASVEKPLSVWLLSYQRSGSTIISFLFGASPRIFFLYEPLESIYSALYGISPGWTAAIDITINRNGTLRKMPALEKDSVTSFLQNVYDCEFDGVPTEFFIHPFWFYFSNWTVMLQPYVACLRAHGLDGKSLQLTQRSVTGRCGRRLGAAVKAPTGCLGKLWPHYPDNERRPSDVGRSGTKAARSNLNVGAYTSSLRQMKKKCSFCVNKYLKAPCKQSRFRAVKTVRGTMDEAEVLLERDPKLKVVHLLRDPRGVTRSRVKATWSRGFYDFKKDELVAHAYCETALRDFQTLNGLKEKFPERVMHILLEDFFHDPEAKLAELSGFLGIRLGVKALDRLEKRLEPAFLDRWRTELSPELVGKINKRCERLMTALNITV